jgi:hypothetical protein
MTLGNVKLNLKYFGPTFMGWRVVPAFAMYLDVRKNG